MKRNGRKYQSGSKEGLSRRDIEVLRKLVVKFSKGKKNADNEDRV